MIYSEIPRCAGIAWQEKQSPAHAGSAKTLADPACDRAEMRRKTDPVRRSLFLLGLFGLAGFPECIFCAGRSRSWGICGVEVTQCCSYVLSAYTTIHIEFCCIF